MAGFSCTFRANFERKRVWSLIGSQWTVHHLPASLIGQGAAFGGFRGYLYGHLSGRYFDANSAIKYGALARARDAQRS